MKKPITSTDLCREIASVVKKTDLVTEGELAKYQPAPPIKMSVLMAEDNVINAKVLSTLLRGIGCSVTWARDGQEALEMASTGNHDIAFVDLRMPKLDGITFTRKFREVEQEGVRLPIIALTANTTTSLRRQCAEAGMDDFLAKPVDELLLRQAIDRYILSR